ncbi:hypothetical protein EPUS_07217 [Endocarpon pusillum Z07020]|uniref:Extracellular serine-rich protein n=1 Tax=Endocarpon pusillum (strain Z07020 / HMAS-L-300199) TaxID=1263415 RepID=U1GM95_ENDPU|nr:uncharacterized protein EPUS_07217 [Endocarpon pusillum Z07020]ERF73383.1 hypothetical protein EPUS_07217 [Endocarpon pusillum Z07020]
MYRLKSIALSSLILLQVSLVKSQSVTSAAAPSISPSSTSSREPITRTVAVSRGDHTFEPDVTLAEVGDYVEFQFYPTNHSIVRAAYKYPCIPFELVETDKVGFFSGFHPVDAILENPPTWTVRINDTAPIFFYCSAPGSCINYGMVGVINPNATTSLEVHREAAEESSFMLQPGQNFPDESVPPDATGTSSSSSSASPTASPTAAPASTTTAAAAAATPHSGLSPGAIAGIAIGAAAVLLMAAVLVYLCGRNRALSDIIRPKHYSTQSADFDSNGVQYVQTVPKHMSGMTMVSARPENTRYMQHSAALPGYVGPHDGVHSPPRTNYAPSDALSPASPVIRSASPGSMVVPAYTQSPPLPSQTPVEHTADGPHEMDGRGLRRNSMHKGGVERYS